MRFSLISPHDNSRTAAHTMITFCMDVYLGNGKNAIEFQGHT